jgi:GT2 family glycosyltransferase
VTVASDPEADVRTTVVIPSYRPGPVIHDVLAALADQVCDRPRRAVLVDSSGGTLAADLRRRYPWLEVVERPERTPQGKARNVGAARSTGGLLAFLDTDAVPEPGWLDALEAALRPGVDAVCGAILNGTPRSLVGTAGYLLEFAEWAPGRRGEPRHAATCNFLVRREAFERLGGFAEDVWTGEDTLLTGPLGREGRLLFAREARVTHVNRTHLRGLLRDQHKHGVGVVSISRRGDFEHGWVNRPALAPLSLTVKVLGVVRVNAGRCRSLARLVRHSPVVVVGLAAWFAGLVGSRRYAYPKLPYPAALDGGSRTRSRRRRGRRRLPSRRRAVRTTYQACATTA